MSKEVSNFQETTRIEQTRFKKEFDEELMRQGMLTKEQRQELFVKKNN